MPGPERDAARREVANRGLIPAAVAHLTRDALGTIDLAALAPVKKLLKQFFSSEPWTAGDAAALAGLVGAGTGWWRYDLDENYAVDFGWRDGRFELDVRPRSTLEETFATPVVPEATPNPRTIRFVTPPIHSGPSRWYESAEGVDDPRVARLFTEFADVANVLVGPDFVAIGLHRPDHWEQLLDPILRAVAAEFAATDPIPVADAVDEQSRAAPTRPRATGASARNVGTALEEAWKDLGARRAGNPADLERIVAAASEPDAAVRQVAARLFVDADPSVAASAWDRLVDDPSRRVRRATVDAIVDANRPELRPILEHALHDTDAWTRWKSLRGLVDLGIAPSRAAVAPLADDPDFGVRLEATRALAQSAGA